VRASCCAASEDTRFLIAALLAMTESDLPNCGRVDWDLVNGTVGPGLGAPTGARKSWKLEA